MRRRILMRTLFVIGWASVGVLLLWIHRTAHLEPDELNVCEAVFRYDIRSLSDVSTHYLTVNEANPPTELIRRLRSDNLRVEPGSWFYSALWEKGAWHWEIRGLDRIDDKTFVVHGGYQNDGLSAAGEDYTVINR